MNLYEVYERYPIALSKAQDLYVWDENGQQYLDLYGGHAVISIGHSHPHYIERITQQLQHIGFYSNSVEMPMQQHLADKLAQLSGCHNYQLFLVNSGAEAVENALKLAGVVTNRKKVISFNKSFHGRTNLALAVTDNPAIQSPFSGNFHTVSVPLNDIDALTKAMDNDVAAVIVEGVQGIAGIYEPDMHFLQTASDLCQEHGAKLIVDEIQSGFGRTGVFFSFQQSGIKPDLITFAKGAGNGFPVGGMLIKDNIPVLKNMLGTTFGGSYLACAAMLAVLEVIDYEALIDNAKQQGTYLKEQLLQIPEVTTVRGRGLMLGVEFSLDCKAIRDALLKQKHIFTGVAQAGEVMRLLPALTIQKSHIDAFIVALKEVIEAEHSSKSVNRTLSKVEG
ncbi:aspartate aminotransferase family protein [Cysteiniphilum sp. 6C5]|uniref:aspartate aminotransferase family protein n=1 Tax=unclassified Cysteiniphilum TaxID=2610889 RepID=UPI003F8368B9